MDKTNLDIMQRRLQAQNSVHLQAGEFEISIIPDVHKERIVYLVYVGKEIIMGVGEAWEAGETPKEAPQAQFYPIRKRKLHKLSEWRAWRKEHGFDSANSVFPQNKYLYFRGIHFTSLRTLIIHYRNIEANLVRTEDWYG